MSYKLHTACRVCGSVELKQYLDLGLMPLSNNLCKEQNEDPRRYPLKVLFCENCNLSQLSIVIDPETLFGHYVYRSSIAQGYVNHCNQLAKDLKAKYSLTPDSFVIDIAGNDGALLEQFKAVIGCKVLNVDPAVNLVPINAEKDIKMFNTFWSLDAAKHLRNTGFPLASVITATNVFAHIDNVKEFLEAVKLVLSPNGVLVLEFPYLIDFIERVEFDTIYFEHLSYFSIKPLAALCRQTGMSIRAVEKIPIHGGSVRVTIKNCLGNEAAEPFTAHEVVKNAHSFLTYQYFADNVRKSVSTFRLNVKQLLADNCKIGAFGASAKGNTLLNCAGITYKDISYIIDETPEKVGKFSPGTGIPIYPLNILLFDQPDYIVLLAWNFKEECIAKLRAAGYRGKFIMPLTFEIIS